MHHPIVCAAAAVVLLITLTSCAERRAADRAWEQFQKDFEAGELPPPRTMSTAATATLAEFNRIEMGMSRSQVVAVVGAPGEVVSEVKLAGYVTIMLQWMNTDGGNMNVMLQNNEVVSKAQFGLP